jgi:hypothetical protein
MRVLPDALDDRRPACVVDVILDRRHAAYLNSRRPQSLFAGHSRQHFLLNGGLDKAMQFLFQLISRAFFPEQRANSIAELS